MTALGRHRDEVKKEKARLMSGGVGPPARTGDAEHNTGTPA